MRLVAGSLSSQPVFIRWMTTSPMALCGVDARTGGDPIPGVVARSDPAEQGLPEHEVTVPGDKGRRRPVRRQIGRERAGPAVARLRDDENRVVPMRDEQV